MNYKDSPVFIVEPNWASSLKTKYGFLFSFFSGRGKGYADTDLHIGQISLNFQYLLTSKEEIKDIIDFFNSNMGRLSAFWVPTWQKDVVVTEAFVSTDTTIIIEDVDYVNAWLANQSIGRHLLFNFPDGSQSIRAVKDAPDSTTLLLDAEIGTDCQENALSSLSVSFVYYVRFASDNLTLKYLTNCAAQTELSFITLNDESPDPIS